MTKKQKPKAGSVAEVDFNVPAVERFVLLSAAELAKPVPPMRWLVRGVWPEKSHGPLAGAKKSLKSWNALALAVAVASGRPYLGIDKHAVTTPGPVLILSGEGGQAPFRRRYQRICAAYGVESAGLPVSATFDVDPLDGAPFRAALARHLDKLQPVLVVLDPLYTYHPANVEAQNLYERGRMLGGLSNVVGHDTALVVVDHYRKTGGANLDLDEIGQSGVAQWADSWILQAHRADPDLDTGRFQLVVEYGSRQWGGDRWNVDWDCGRFNYDAGEPETDITWSVEAYDGTAARRSGRLGTDELKTEIVLHVNEHPPATKKQTINAVMEKTHTGRDRVTLAFDALAEERVLVPETVKQPQERAGNVVPVATTVWRQGDLRIKRTGEADRSPT